MTAKRAESSKMQGPGDWTARVDWMRQHHVSEAHWDGQTGALVHAVAGALPATETQPEHSDPVPVRSRDLRALALRAGPGFRRVDGNG